MAPQVRTRLLVVVAVLLAITATYVGQGVLIALMLARIFGGQGVDSILPLLVGAVVLLGVRAALLVWRERVAISASGMVKKALRQRLIDKLFALGPGWLQRTRTGSVQSTVVDGVEAVDPYVGQFLPQAVATVVGASAITAYIVVLDPLVGGIVLACAAATPLVPLLSERLMKSKMDRWWSSYRRLYADNLDALQGMATLKSFNASRRRGTALGHKAEEFCADSIRVLYYWWAFVGAVGLASAGGTAVAVAVGAVHRVDGLISTTELLLILLLARECFRPLRDLETAYHASWSWKTASTGIFELLDADPEVPDAADATDAAGERPGRAMTTAPALTFEDVTFAYRERTRPALDGFSLDVTPGERVALVGRSGAGKTTVVALLMRFFELRQGRITIDGRDIRELRLEELRAMIAVVSQDTYLFHGTVRENLQLARADADADELAAAATAARAHEFIQALPQGYDTVVGERGLRLSGGERQRIAIARALLKDAPVLVLDEATSSVDAANEAGISDAVDALSRGRTTLVIAHRLSTVRDADRVVVLEDGRVTEVDDHAGLLARQGAYARLVAAQGSTR
ncbi:MAG: ABC transporter ATP-binding protein/permease [Pseudonocardia sp.]